VTLQSDGAFSRDVPKAIFFDLDDTLLNHTGNLESSWEPVLARAAEMIPGLEPAELREAIRVFAEDYWSDADRHREGRLNLRAARQRVVSGALEAMGHDPALGAELGNLYHDLRESGYDLLPGAIETLEAFRDAGVRLALITNGEALLQRSKLERFDLARHFDHIQIEEEFGHGKPDERAYRHALDTLDLEPRDVWMVGDNLEWEIAAPQRLGIFSIWVDRSGTGIPYNPEVKPDRVVTSVRELLDCLPLSAEAPAQ
jgi:putative hydrolase of the HAD superfamily